MKFRPKKFFGFVALIAGLASCGIGLWLLLSPAQYQAAVRVQVERDDPNDYNPYFIQTTFEIVRSDTILSNVVEKLNLLENWDGHRATMAAAIHRLKWQTTAQPVRNVHGVMEIRVIDKNPETAARIANTIGRVYCDYRIELARGMRISGLESMEDAYQKEIININVQREELKGLKKQLNPTNERSAQPKAESSYSAYTQAEHSLTNEEAIHRERAAIIASVKSHDNSSAALMFELGVKIVNLAAPPSAPIGPNRPLGLVWLVCGLGMSALGCYLISNSGITTRIEP